MDEAYIQILFDRYYQYIEDGKPRKANRCFKELDKALKEFESSHSLQEYQTLIANHVASLDRKIAKQKTVIDDLFTRLIKEP